MKLGIVICAFDRPEYLKECLDTVAVSDIPEGTTVIIVDDHSTNAETINLINNLRLQVPVVKIRNSINSKISASLKAGFTKAIQLGCDPIMNLDADIIVKKDWIRKLLSLWKRFPDHVITGFNCLTKNRDGSIRHVVVKSGDDYSFKESINGVNMLMSQKLYTKYMRPSLESTLKGGNWDHLTSIAGSKDGRFPICTVPSVLQHIGINSSLNHNHDEPDIADDFYDLELPSVTLIGVDCINSKPFLEAAKMSQRNIKFGAVKLLSSLDFPGAIKIPKISSKQEYSRFLIKELYKYVDTEHALIFQHDGYLVNRKAWDPDFLKYDYVGATWWYTDGMNVGNGGFSLRSKRLLTTVATDRTITQMHPEDHHICRTYRKHLEETHAIKFAPEDVAARFSHEGWNQPTKYSDQFGFHGFNNVKEVPPPVKKMLINQPFGLGDILFAIPLVRGWIDEGYEITWPIQPKFLSIAKHFPEIKFVNESIFSSLLLHNKTEQLLGGYRIIPLRWAGERILKLPYKDVMKAKYMLYGKDVSLWRELSWKRDTVAEQKLYKIHNLNSGSVYNLVNFHFRGDASGVIRFRPDNKYRTIEMRNVPGFSMLDWAMLWEHATEIHSVGTSIIYPLDVDFLNIKCPVHYYIRRPDESNFSYYDYLLKRTYIWHNNV